MGRWSTATFFLDRLSTVTTMCRMMLSGTSSFSSACGAGQRGQGRVERLVALIQRRRRRTVRGAAPAERDAGSRARSPRAAALRAPRSLPGPMPAARRACDGARTGTARSPPATTTAAAPQMMGLSEAMAIRPVRRTRAAGEGPVEQTAGDAAAEAGAGHILQRVRRALENGVRGTVAAADGRADALAHVAGRKTGGIPGDERIADARHLHVAAQVVAVADRIVGARPWRACDRAWRSDGSSAGGCRRRCFLMRSAMPPIPTFR